MNKIVLGSDFGPNNMHEVKRDVVGKFDYDAFDKLMEAQQIRSEHNAAAAWERARKAILTH